MTDSETELTAAIEGARLDLQEAKRRAYQADLVLSGLHRRLRQLKKGNE